jgi:RNA polymerase-interacting CarD/CdnL/TRCF family regulator
MDYKPGDYVVHPNHGLGTVVTVEEMDFDKNQPKMFYRVDFRNTTVWVPVYSEKIGGLRPLTEINELNAYREVLKSAPEILDDDFRKRQMELENRLEEGTLLCLIKVVRDLSARNELKPLNNYDTAMLRQTREALIQEWSVTGGVSPAEAASEIEALLSNARHYV